MDEPLIDEETVEEAVVENKKPVAATLEMLKKKQHVTKTLNLVVGSDDGDTQEVSLSFRGIPAKDYDKLISQYPPTPRQKKEGYAYDPDKFGPALLAATCIEPAMTLEDATEIWESETWNRGERMLLLMAAIEVCTAGLDLPKSESVFG